MHTNRINGIIILMLAGMLTLSGCGGGGDSSAATTAPTTRPIATDYLRIFASGDNILYAINGNISNMASNTSSTFSGTASFTVLLNSSPADPYGNVRSMRSINLNAKFASGTPVVSVSNSYFSQKNDGSVIFYGSSDAGWITAPVSGSVIDFVSPIVAPNGYAATYTLQNGDSVSEQTTVIGKESVSTNMGTFEAYRTERGLTYGYADGSSFVASTVEYVVPSIGSIKMVQDISFKNNIGVITSTMHREFSANTTNIPF